MDLSNAYVNPWQDEHQIIASTDWAKWEEMLESLQYASWDLVIVDENLPYACQRSRVQNRSLPTERGALFENLSFTCVAAKRLVICENNLFVSQLKLWFEDGPLILRWRCVSAVLLPASMSCA